MKFEVTFKTALNSLKVNFVRSLLTVLGVVIGVFTVVTLISLVQGLQNYVVGEFEKLGSNLVFVYPGSGGLTNDPALAFSNNKLSEKHVELIKREASEVVDKVSPILQTGGAVSYKNRDYYASIWGGDALTQDIFNFELEDGRFFTPAEVRSDANVAIIGHLIRKELFQNLNPIGREIEVEGKTFEVIGYVPPKGPDYDEQVLVPIGQVEKIFELDNYTYIGLTLKSDADVSADIKLVELALLKDLTTEDFTLYTQEDLLTQVQSILDILKFGLAAVSGISLLVGGIGIMNIMLVSVTERISEIGLRKALGATAHEIALQFLMESVVLSLLGGLIGLAFGFGGCLIARQWIDSEITPQMIALSLGFSLVVGVVFGTYPAVQAAKKDPIEALRYE
ncbi:FtsX-like permease family protein [candidate division WWE3 bacterium]|nr:FtsX-like permease family protein [candidate division WWE3 bacterium]